MSDRIQYWESQYRLEEWKKNRKERSGWYISDFGSCMRGVTLARKGIEPPPYDFRTLTNFAYGHAIEDMVVKSIPQEFLVDTQGLMEFEEVDDLHGRYDALIKVPNEQWFVLEVKSVHSKKFWWQQKEGNGPDKHYQIQVNAYIHDLQKTHPGIKGIIYMVSKDDSVRSEAEVEYSPELWEETKAYFDELNRYWKKDEMPPQAPAIVDGRINWRAKYCSMHTICENNEFWLVEAEAQLKEDKLNNKQYATV